MSLQRGSAGPRRTGAVSIRWPRQYVTRPRDGGPPERTHACQPITNSQTPLPPATSVVTYHGSRPALASTAITTIAATKRQSNRTLLTDTPFCTIHYMTYVFVSCKEVWQACSPPRNPTA